MKNEVVPVQIRGILPANSGCALFVGNDNKVFVINVEPQMGSVIGMFLRDTPKERPLTHDLINRIFQGFGINVERVIITDLKNSTYFARIILQQQNEVARKIVELDARPSDCLALAAAQKMRNAPPHWIIDRWRRCCEQRLTYATPVRRVQR